MVHAEQRGLGFRGGAQFVLLMLAAGFRFILFSLTASLGLVSLPLLPCLFFLALCKC